MTPTATDPAPTVVWFRRDLRLHDHGALAAAPGPVLPLFVVDPRLFASAGGPRQAYLLASLRELHQAIRDRGGAGLLVRHGDPVAEVAQVARAIAATEVLVSGDYSPAGLRRDRAVADALAEFGVRLRAADSPFLHAPGSITKNDGTGFAVFTPFYRSWGQRPVPQPYSGSATARFVAELPAPTQWPEPVDSRLSATPEVGEDAARRRLVDFAAAAAKQYDRQRNRVDVAGTSRLSAALHFGELHPRTVVEHTGSADAFVRQLCWREFYADVLYRRPEVAWHNVDRRFDALPWHDDRSAFEAWCEGRTGYPLVDAGMRQLASEGWLHNRARLVVASFLTKDLLLPWQWGARWFLRHLIDGDVANNNLGWQGCAGTGMDPSPYYRIFNPVLQGLKFDPTGDYVRHYVPELRHLPAAAVHEPWNAPDGYDHGYPARIVDHAVARTEALAAYEPVRQSARDTG